MRMLILDFPRGSGIREGALRENPDGQLARFGFNVLPERRCRLPRQDDIGQEPHQVAGHQASQVTWRRQWRTST